jgi:hypothetical protein
MTIFINHTLYVGYSSSSQYGTGVLHYRCERLKSNVLYCLLLKCVLFINVYYIII